MKVVRMNLRRALSQHALDESKELRVGRISGEREEMWRKGKEKGGRGRVLRAMGGRDKWEESKQSKVNLGLELVILYTAISRKGNSGWKFKISHQLCYCLHKARHTMRKYTSTEISFIHVPAMRRALTLESGLIVARLGIYRIPRP